MRFFDTVVPRPTNEYFFHSFTHSFCLYLLPTLTQRTGVPHMALRGPNVQVQGPGPESQKLVFAIHQQRLVDTSHGVGASSGYTQEWSFTRDGL
jgi:hypothetical protein